jgi:hypothetical protein
MTKLSENGVLSRTKVSELPFIFSNSAKSKTTEHIQCQVD